MPTLPPSRGGRPIDPDVSNVPNFQRDGHRPRGEQRAPTPGGGTERRGRSSTHRPRFGTPGIEVGSAASTPARPRPRPSSPDSRRARRAPLTRLALSADTAAAAAALRGAGAGAQRGGRTTPAPRTARWPPPNKAVLPERGGAGSPPRPLPSSAPFCRDSRESAALISLLPCEIPPAMGSGLARGLLTESLG